MFTDFSAFCADDFYPISPFTPSSQEAIKRLPISLNSGLSAIYTGITARVSVTASAIRLKVAETTDIIIFHDVSFIAAGAQIFGILIVFFPQDQGQGLNGALVLQILFRPRTFGVEQNGAEFQGGIVGDSKPPVGGNIACCILQITVDDPEKIGDFLFAGLVRPQPAVFKPFLQAHFHHR